MTAPKNCERCPALVGVRTQVVYGRSVGDAPSYAFIGQGPGREEDESGRPFVGQSGRVQAALLKQAGISLQDVYLDNACKCLTPANRKPKVPEINSCREFLLEDLAAVDPKVIIALGGSAVDSLYGRASLDSVIGQVYLHPVLGKPVIPTYHPAFLVRGEWGAASLVLAHLETAKQVAEGKQQVESLGQYQTITTVPQLKALRDYLMSCELVSLDCETTGTNWMTDEIMCLSFSGEPGEGYTVPILKRGPATAKSFEDPVWFWDKAERGDVIAILKDILWSSSEKALQNGSFDIRFFERHASEEHITAETAFGWPLLHLRHDTLLISRTINENLPAKLKPHELPALLGRHTGMPPYEEEVRKQSSNKSKMAEVDDADLRYYAAADADAVSRLTPVLAGKLAEDGRSRWAYEHITIPMVRCCQEMSRRGILVDMDYFTKLCLYHVVLAEALSGKVYKAAGKEFNINSPQQVQAVLFEDFGLTPLKKTDAAVDCPTCKKNAYCSKHNATDEETLIALKERAGEQEPVVLLLDAILEWRSLHKKRGTYLDGTGGESDGFLGHIRPDSRIHAEFNVGGAATGRLSCVPLDTEILTTMGWKPWNELDLSETVYGYDLLNSKTVETPLLAIHRGRQKVGRLWFRPSDAKLHIDHPARSVRCTAQHRWVGEQSGMIGWIESQSLPRWSTKIRLGSGIAFPAGLSKISETDAAILGWAITDGYEKNAARHDRRPSLAVRVIKTSSIEALELLLAKVPHSRYHIPKRQNSPVLKPAEEFYLGTAEWKGIKERTGYQDLSSVESVILAMSITARQAMWNAMMEADGSRGLRAPRFAKSKPGVRDAFILLSLLLGYWPVTTKSTLPSGKPFWTTYLRGSPLVQRTRWDPSEQEEEEEVWCPETGAGTWFMRQGTVVVLTGNSSSPNMQNIPNDVVIPELRTMNAFRRTFIALPGYAVFDADWSQLELWVLAYKLAEDFHDRSLIDLLESGRDVHSIVARHIWSEIDPDLDDYEWQKEHEDVRRNAKVFSFGITYGMTVVGIQERLHCEEAEAARLLGTYFNLVPGLPDYIEHVHQTIREGGVLETWSGRRRRFPEAAVMLSLHDKRVNNAVNDLYRIGVNFPIQGGGGDLHSLAHIASEENEALRRRARIVNAVHDSCLFEGEAPSLDHCLETAWMIKNLWQTISLNTERPNGERLGWQVPVGVRWGQNWGDMPHVLTVKGDYLDEREREET